MASRLASGAFILSFLCGTLVWAQGTTTIVGLVLDNDGKPVPDVQVLLQYKGHIPQKHKTKSDKKGRFIYINAYSGRYDVTLSKEGLGEAMVKDFVFRDLASTEQPPVFRIGATKAAPPPQAAVAGLGQAGPAAQDPAAQAAAIEEILRQTQDLLASGRVDDAQITLEALVAKAPDSAPAFSQLGRTYKKKGDVAKAQAAFEKALSLKPDLAEPHAELSLLLYGAGKLDEATAHAKAAADAAPANASYRYNLGICYAQSGKTAEAKEALLKAEELDPADPEIQYQLGTLAIAANEKAEAIARFEKYVTAAPADAPNVATAKALIAALGKK
jgi:type IV pilus assembly protein PilF